jgi:transposase
VQSADPRDLRITRLEAALAARDALIAKLVSRIEVLEAQVVALSRNSTNSSKPPSSDPPGVDRPNQKPSGKRRGGQPGHKPYSRKLLPLDKVDVVVPLVPKTCDHCGADLHGRDPGPLRHQVVEIPPITPFVTEYQQHALGCDECGAITRAELPMGVPAGSFGPRLSAMLAILTAKYRLSKRAVRELLSDFLGVELSLGSVANVEQQVSAALAAPVAEAREHVRQADGINADETSWSENKRKAWLWVAATSLVTVFVIAKSRGAVVAKDLLGETFRGVLTTDRWSAYNWITTGWRQICWSHLLRDFQSWVDGGGAGKRLGARILVEARRMFRWWHKVRDGTMTREKFAKKMSEVQLNVVMLLTEASTCRTRRVRGMAAEMLKLEWAFWTFIDKPGVEPTNNFGERQIRHAVLWRKGCFGTDSVVGSRFVERMLTTITTLRQQERNVLEFITAACTSQLNASAAPSLLHHRAHVRLAAA